MLYFSLKGWVSNVSLLSIFQKIVTKEFYTNGPIKSVNAAKKLLISV